MTFFSPFGFIGPRKQAILAKIKRLIQATIVLNRMLQKKLWLLINWCLVNIFGFNPC